MSLGPRSDPGRPLGAAVASSQGQGRVLPGCRVAGPGEDGGDLVVGEHRLGLAGGAGHVGAAEDASCPMRGRDGGGMPTAPWEPCRYREPDAWVSMTAGPRELLEWRHRVDQLVIHRVPAAAEVGPVRVPPDDMPQSPSGRIPQRVRDEAEGRLDTTLMRVGQGRGAHPADSVQTVVGRPRGPAWLYCSRAAACAPRLAAGPRPAGGARFVASVQIGARDDPAVIQFATASPIARTGSVSATPTA